MLKRSKSFKGDFPLVVEENPPSKEASLSDAEVGDVFIREGSLCMKVKNQTQNGLPDGPEDHTCIVSLQTGAVWYAHDTGKIMFVDAILNVKRYHE